MQSLDDRIRQIGQQHRQDRAEYERRRMEIDQQYGRQTDLHSTSRRDLYLVNNGRHDGWCHAYDNNGQLQTRYDIGKGVVPREFAKGEDGQYHERIERHSPTMSMVPPGYRGREAYTYHEYQNVNDQYKMHDARNHQRSPEIDRYHTQQMQQSQEQNQPWYIQAQDGQRHGQKQWSMEAERERDRINENREAYVKQLKESGRNPLEELRKQNEQQSRQAQGEIRQSQQKTHKPVAEIQRDIQERDRVQTQERDRSGTPMGQYAHNR